jgi:hypothetical protein
MYVLSCDECQRVGNISRHNEMPMSYTLVIEPFDYWGFDFMGPFPPSKGYTHILVAVNYVTKWVEAIPTKSADSETSLKILKDVIFPWFCFTLFILPASFYIKNPNKIRILGSCYFFTLVYHAVP